MVKLEAIKSRDGNSVAIYVNENLALDFRVDPNTGVREVYHYGSAAVLREYPSVTDHMKEKINSGEIR